MSALELLDMETPPIPKVYREIGSLRKVTLSRPTVSGASTH